MALVAVAPLNDIVDDNVRAIGMDDAPTMTAIRRLIVTDLAVTVDESRLALMARP